MATLVVTSASAVALNNTAGGSPNASTNLNRAMPATLPIGGNTADLEQRERSQQRPDRSERKQATAGQTGTGKTSALAQDRTFAQQRAAWEAKQAERIAAAEQKAQGGNSGTAVVPRVIEWVAPIESYSLSAGFGESSSLWSTTHTGQDFSADLGTPVQSVGDGTVEYVGWDGAYGKQVRILHEDGTETWYSHLSDYGVSTGETVDTGETIGYVGSTGNSTGPHLHFEVRPYSGDPIDPMPWLRERGVSI